MASKLELILRKVGCIDETNDGFTEIIGQDDIGMGGAAVDMDGTTVKIPQFSVGKFDDGKVKVFSKPLAVFNLAKGSGFPRTYAVTLILAERDHGGLTKLVDQLPGAITSTIKSHVSKVAGAAAKTAGAGVGTLVGGPVGTALGALAGGKAIELFGKFGKALGDDVFPPQTLEQTVTSATQKFPGGEIEKSLIFKGHGGKYRVVCEWRLT